MNLSKESMANYSSGFCNTIITAFRWILTLANKQLPQHRVLQKVKTHFCQNTHLVESTNAANQHAVNAFALTKIISSLMIVIIGLNISTVRILQW